MGGFIGGKGGRGGRAAPERAPYIDPTQDPRFQAGRADGSRVGARHSQARSVLGSALPKIGPG
jgi:hypothetical protein